jgi:hypothetical protein
MTGFIPRWRIFSYVIIAINVLFLVWVIGGAASGSGHASNCGGLDQQTCDSAAHAGTAIGVALIIVFWAVVDVILGVLWLITKPRGRRDCPVCGMSVKRGRTSCVHCGYDFMSGVQGVRQTP